MNPVVLNTVALFVFFTAVHNSYCGIFKTSVGRTCHDDSDCSGGSCFGIIPFTKEVCIGCSTRGTFQCGCVSVNKGDTCTESGSFGEITTEDTICGVRGALPHRRRNPGNRKRPRSNDEN